MSLVNDIVNEFKGKRKVYSILSTLFFLTIFISFIYTASSLEPMYRPIHDGTFDSEIINSLFYDSYGHPMDNIFLNKVVGGSNNDVSVAIASDAKNNIIIAGYTMSVDFPLKNEFQSTFGGGAFDAFLSKYSNDGDLIWSTYLGGSAQETVWDMIVDPQDDSIILTGWTSSSNFPLLNPVQPIFGGAWDMFLTRFSASGELEFSSFLGGSDGDEGLGIRLSNSNEIIVVGRTSSSDFPVVNAYQPNLANTGTDGFIFSYNGSQVVFSTYLGGSNYDMIYDVDIDISGNIYAVGTTYSVDFPVINEITSSLGGLSDGFISKLNEKGEMLLCAYFGGNKTDSIKTVKINSNNHLIISGDTNSDVFQGLTGTFGQVNNESIFLVDFTLDLNNNTSILFGGSSEDRVLSLAINDEDDIYISGISSSKDLPTVRAEHEMYAGGGYDLFISKFSSDLSLRTSSYFGGNQEDQSLGINLNSQGDLMVSGFTNSTDSNFLPSYSYGEDDAFFLIKGDLDDFDNDTLPKFWEKRMGLNDNSNSDKLLDLDSDRITNLQEYLLGLNANDPDDALMDFDRDLLPTYYEVQMGFNAFSKVDTYTDSDFDGVNNIIEYSYRLNATNNADVLLDWDNDGLSTIQEISIGTDPRNFDTDYDNFSDGLENSFNQLLGSPVNYIDNIITRILIVFFLIISSSILSLLIFSLSKQSVNRYKINKRKEIGEVKLILSDIQVGLGEINTRLVNMESRISEIRTIEHLNSYQLELDSYIGPRRDLEIQTNKYLRHAKNLELKDYFEKIFDEENQFKSHYSKQKASLNILQNNFIHSERKNYVSSDESFCFYCGAIIDGNNEKCNYCMQDVHNCQICKRIINFGDEIGTCLYCNHIFHYTHLAETVKIMGKCAVCREKLNVDEILNSLPFKNKKT